MISNAPILKVRRTVRPAMPSRELARIRKKIRQSTCIEFELAQGADARKQLTAPRLEESRELGNEIKRWRRENFRVRRAY